MMKPRRRKGREAVGGRASRNPWLNSAKFWLRHGLWGSVTDIPPPPDPPFDIETFEPIEPPWQAIREWIPDDDAAPDFDLFDQRLELRLRPPWAGEAPRKDGCILVLDPG